MFEGMGGIFTVIGVGFLLGICFTFIMSCVKDTIKDAIVEADKEIKEKINDD